MNKKVLVVLMALCLTLALATGAAAEQAGLYFGEDYYSESYIAGMTLMEKVALSNQVANAPNAYYVMRLGGVDKYVVFGQYTGFSSFRDIPADGTNPIPQTVRDVATGKYINAKTGEDAAPPVFSLTNYNKNILGLITFDIMVSDAAITSVNLSYSLGEVQPATAAVTGGKITGVAVNAEGGALTITGNNGKTGTLTVTAGSVVDPPTGDLEVISIE